MPLNEDTKEVEWAPTHYVCVKKIGSFDETAPACWGEFKAQVSAAVPPIKGLLNFTLYQTSPECVYCAGSSVESVPAELPVGFEYIHFIGGKYLQFTLTGSYSQFPEAMGRLFHLVKERNVAVRENAYFVEHYVNSPDTTPEEELLTYILVPIN